MKLRRKLKRSNDIKHLKNKLINTSRPSLAKKPHYIIKAPISMFTGIATKRNDQATKKCVLAQNALLSKLETTIPSFEKDSISSFGGDLILGKGAFGTVTLCKIIHMNIAVAAKTISGTLSDVKAEIYVMQRLAGHPCFPYVYGLHLPGRILMEFIGTINDGNIVPAKPVRNYIGKKELGVSLWYTICRHLVDAMMFLHNKDILHNDLHSRNIVLRPKSMMPVVIDFGKATLATHPLTYNIKPGTKQWDQYNKFHQHLAYELRNMPGSPQTIYSDVFSLGSILKEIGHFENITDIFNIGRKMKRQSSMER